MKTNDTELRRLFVRATDEVIPPAPWLETRVVAALERRTTTRRPVFDLGALRGLAPGLRLTAGVIAILLALLAVAALLMSARLLHQQTVPGARSSAPYVEGSIIPFAPSPAVRGTGWPPGGPVPANLAGSWQKSQVSPTLHLAAYTFQLGEERDGPSIDPTAFGNVVVNGSEIDFISDVCTARAQPGFERYSYLLTGNVLVLIRSKTPGQANCTDGLPWPDFGGTYSRVSTVQAPDFGIVPFTPSPAVRGANWPPGEQVPADLAGAWQPAPASPACKATAPMSCVLHLGVYTFQVGEEYTNPPPPGNATPPLYGNVVVNGSEIDFISDVCTINASFGFERYRFTLSGNTLVLTRAPGAGQTNCGGGDWPYWPDLSGSYSRVAGG